MDNFNIITITDDLGSLNADMMDWSCLPFDLRRRSDEDCIRKFGCTNKELYNKIKLKILSSQDARTADYSNNLVSESTIFSEYDDYYDKLTLSNELQLSPFIVIIDPSIDSMDELNLRMDSFNRLNEKDKRLSNLYSQDIWGYDVYNMYTRVKGNIETDNIDKDLTNNLVKVDESTLYKPVLENYVTSLYNNDIISATLMSSVAKESISESSNITEYTAHRFYSDKMKQEYDLFMEFNTSILPDVCPWLTAEELRKQRIPFTEIGDHYYKDMIRCECNNPSELLEFGWTRFCLPSDKQNLKEARERQAIFIKSISPMMVDVREMTLDPKVIALNTEDNDINLSYVYFVFGYDETPDKYVKRNYTKVGITIDLDNVYTFNGVDNTFNGFTEEKLSDYKYFDLVAIFMNYEDVNNLIVKVKELNNNIEMYPDKYFNSPYSLLLNNMKNPDSIDSNKVVYLQYIEMLIKILDIDLDGNNILSFYNTPNFKNGNYTKIFKLYSGYYSEFDVNTVYNIINILTNTDNIRNFAKSVCESHKILNDNQKYYDNIYDNLIPVPIIYSK